MVSDVHFVLASNLLSKCTCNGYCIKSMWFQINCGMKLGWMSKIYTNKNRRSDNLQVDIPTSFMKSATT